VCILLRTTEMDVGEEQLSFSMVAFVGGARLVALLAQVSSYLHHHFAIDDGDVRIHCYRAGSFLLCFRDGVVANHVLQAPRSPTSNIILSFGRFTHQARLLFSPLHYKVLISIENIPAHTWSICTAQKVLGSSELIFDVVTVSASFVDLSQFLVMTWVKQPDLFPNEVGGIVPELVALFVEREPPRFLSSSELIHSRCDTLQFCDFIRVLEVHDYRISEGSNDYSSDSSGDSSNDSLRVPAPSSGSSLHPWPRI
jgi:hypothetical protein